MCRFLSAMLATAYATAAFPSEIQVAESIPFRNESQISKVVIEECDLPHKQLEALTEKAASQGFELVQRPGLTSKHPGKVLLIEIVRAGLMSTGTRDVKQMTVTGKLFEDGEQVGSFVAQRRSNGGVFGITMRVCAVLHKCADAIAGDVATWLAHPTPGAQLGERGGRLSIEP